MSATKETLGFQTEVKQLLHLMIHSLYSNKEIFLRELVSNASDACDKLRFEALNNAGLFGDDSDLKIRIAFDKEARTLTISDNGIGLTRDEAVEHLGTIAKSGTREFFSALTGDQAKDAHLIGQFGVGFYSSYIVADKVTVVSRRAGVEANQAVKWESAGEGEFSVEMVEKAGRGTDVILHLRDGEDDFLNSWKLKQIVRKYSDHITLPIVMKGEKWDEEKKEQVATEEDETINQASALWARPKSEITDEQYKEFYKHVAHDFEEPLSYVHAKVEGKQEYTQLLYIPQRAPFDMWDRNARHGIKLYVRRVFIMDDAEQLMPLYMRFVRGIVDSEDTDTNRLLVSVVGSQPIPMPFAPGTYTPGEMVDVNRNATMRQMGARDIQVLRGVEDTKAYEQGLNNTVTAFDLALIFEKMARNKPCGKKASRQMLDILSHQKFRDIIPARLPAEVKVAHKTGSITGVQHDSGLIFLPNGKKYVLVLLSRKLKDVDAGVEALADVSGMVYRFFVAR